MSQKQPQRLGHQKDSREDDWGVDSNPAGPGPPRPHGGIRAPALARLTWTGSPRPPGAGGLAPSQPRGLASVHRLQSLSQGAAETWRQRLKGRRWERRPLRAMASGTAGLAPPTFFRLQGELVLHSVLAFQAGCGDPALLFGSADEPPAWERECRRKAVGQGGGLRVRTQ